VKDKVNFVNGKWSLSSKAKESGNYVYHEGDWHYREKKKYQKKLQPTKNKMNCVGFPSGKIKSTLEMLTAYAVSSLLGVSLALNIVFYIQSKNLEKQNLELIEILQKN